MARGLLRSVLFVPASREKLLQKTTTLAADSYIFDLEDAVAPDKKEKARDKLCQFLQSAVHADRTTLAVRINSLATPWGYDDLKGVAKMRQHIDALVLPKVESDVQVQQALEVITAGAAATDPPIPVWCMVETPKGVLNVEKIAAHASVSVLVAGTADLTKDLHANHTRDRTPILHSLSRVLLAARAYGTNKLSSRTQKAHSITWVVGVAALDGVHLDVQSKDAEFERVCQQGRDMGFDGKTLIHPKTIDAANVLFGPSADEIQFAHRVIEAHHAALAAGSGVTVVDGMLIETLHFQEAERIVQLARDIQLKQQESF